MLMQVSVGRGIPACDTHATRVEAVTLEVNRAPYFVDLLREQLLQRYSVED